MVLQRRGFGLTRGPLDRLENVVGNVVSGHYINSMKKIVQAKFYISLKVLFFRTFHHRPQESLPDLHS